MGVGVSGGECGQSIGGHSGDGRGDGAKKR